MSDTPTAVRPTADAATGRRAGGQPGRAWWDGNGVWLAVALLVVVAVARFPNSPATGFTFDTGIQMNLSRLTAEGAVPIRDFEHGWNAGAWYIGALLWLLSGANPDVWWYLFSVGGTLVAGLAVVWVLARRGLPPAWLVLATGAWIALARVPHLKYAVPAVVLAVLVATWRWSAVTAVSVRIGMFAVLAVTHVELAVLLAGGLALYEVSASPRLDPAGLVRPDRLLAILAGVIGVVVGLGLELAAYAAIGVPPGEVLRHLITDQTVVDPAVHFGYPLLDPGDLRTAVTPAAILIPFLPGVWTGLHRTTRLAACLQLALVVIALRRTDTAHVAAAMTLLPLVAALLLHDVQPRLAAVRATGIGRIARRWLAGGLLAVVAVVGIAFNARSLVAGAVLGGAALAGIALSRWATPASSPSGGAPVAVRRASRTASLTVGGLLGAVLVLTASLGGRVVSSATTLPGDAETVQLAEALREPLARCTGGDPAVWVVPHPLGLYAELGLDNPTPYVMFHYPFAREHDRVMAMVDAGDIPTIVTYGPWLPSFEGLEARLEATYTECARLDPPEVPAPVRVLRWDGA